MSQFIWRSTKKKLFSIALIISGFFSFLYNNNYSDKNFITMTTTLAQCTDCTELTNRTKTYNFVEFLWKISDETVSDLEDFAIVLPTRMKYNIENSLSCNQFCPLLNLLQKNIHILTIAPSIFSNDSIAPFCTLDRAQWTVRMSTNFSKFKNAKSVLHDENKIIGSCYACDLLPDIFVANLKALKLLKNKKKLKNLLDLSDSARLPFFLEIRGKSAYCPDYESDGVRLKVDYSRNYLSRIFDGKFYMIPNISGIYRLVISTSKPGDNATEAWLGCVWWKRAYQLNLPIHCSNFLRQYLFDVVDLLENFYRIEYRLWFGTAIGALRNKNIIPWTVDVDVYALLSKTEFDEFRNGTLSNLQIASHGRYTDVSSKDDENHREPSRVFPLSPIVLHSSRPQDRLQIDNVTRNRLIDQILTNNTGTVSSNRDWRSFGYVDIYSLDYLTKCLTKDNSDVNDMEFVEISNRFFKTFRNALDKLGCEFGANVTETLPLDSYSDWTSFIDF